MKKQVSGFVSGVLVSALVCGLGTAALAATGKMTIEVSPINIQVNGAEFHPKDEKGNDVPVFAYDGTTYAPLRALAKAYGLEVDYDAQTNMASVTDPDAAPTPSAPPADYSDWSAEDEAAYQEFKGMWEVTIDTRTLGQIITAQYIGISSYSDVVEMLRSNLVLIRRFSTECADANIPSNPLDFYYNNERVANVVMLNAQPQAIFIEDQQVD